MEKENTKKRNLYSLFSNDEKTAQIIEKFKDEDPKTYRKLLSLLRILGNFSSKSKVEIYESKKTEEENYIKLGCIDLDDNVFIFCPISENKKDKTIVEKASNNICEVYDMSLLKKFDLSSDNVSLLQTKKIYNFKFGRIITDEDTFYNMFLGNDICFTTKFSGIHDKVDIQHLLALANSYDSTLKFKDYMEMMSKLIAQDNIKYENILLETFKDFKKVGSIVIGDKSNVENDKRPARQRSDSL